MATEWQVHQLVLDEDGDPYPCGWMVEPAHHHILSPQRIPQPPSVEELEQDPDPQQKEAATLLKLGVGFWQETTVMCTLKGGTPAPEGGSTSIEVKLRAYVNSV